MTREDSRPIALIGMMGAGKSSVARVLGERLGVSVADLDGMIEAVEGCSVAELFERAGEPWFRRREGELLAEAVRSGVKVVACGGGIVLDPARRKLLRERCRVVWLEVEPEEALRRVRADGGDPARTRPMLAGADPEQRLRDLLRERAPLYAEAAHVRVATAGRTAEEVADAVLQALAPVGRTGGG
jgi:shikimate kinase